MTSFEDEMRAEMAEMRIFMKQTGISRKIIVMASPNVQDNFRLQLFDPRKLVYENNKWTLNTCIGNALLREINPADLEGLSREKVVKMIRTMIRKYYRFMGYDSVALYSDSEVKNLQRKEKRRRKQQGDRESASFLQHVEKNVPEILDLEPIKPSDDPETRTQKKKAIQKLKEKFDYRLIVVDEFHNMVARKENTKKSAAKILTQIVRFCKFTRILLLSAT